MKHKRDRPEISISGTDTPSSAFRPCSQQVGKETEESERDKVQCEEREAKTRSAKYLLSAIAEATKMQDQRSVPLYGYYYH